MLSFYKEVGDQSCLGGRAVRMTGVAVISELFIFACLKTGLARAIDGDRQVKQRPRRARNELRSSPSRSSSSISLYSHLHIPPVYLFFFFLIRRASICPLSFLSICKVIVIYPDAYLLYLTRPSVLPCKAGEVDNVIIGVISHWTTCRSALYVDLSLAVTPLPRGAEERERRFVFKYFMLW